MSNSKTKLQKSYSANSINNQELELQPVVKTGLLDNSQTELVVPGANNDSPKTTPEESKPIAQDLVKKPATVQNSTQTQFKRVWISLIFLTLLNLIAFGLLSYQNWSTQKATNSRLDSLNEMLVDSQGPLAPMFKLVADLPVDRSQFKTCLQSNKFQQTIQNQLQEATTSGVQSTPTHIIFDTQTNKTRLIEGALPVETLSKELVAFQNNQPTTITTKSPNPRTELAVRKPDVNQDNWKGSKEARYVWIVYADFECPYCKVASGELKKLLLINPNLAFVYRHFPLTQIHPNAQKLAEASECYKDQYGQNGFWLISDKINNN